MKFSSYINKETASPYLEKFVARVLPAPGLGMGIMITSQFITVSIPHHGGETLLLISPIAFILGETQIFSWPAEEAGSKPQDWLGLATFNSVLYLICMKHCIQLLFWKTDEWDDK